MQEKKNQKDLKELAVFEMLEDAANDSSFCSTSSRVKTLMNHSILPSPQVPLALYPIQRASLLVWVLVWVWVWVFGGLAQG